MNEFPRLDILPAAQRRLWRKLEMVKSNAFVLYGGTAVALYLGHRESVDFDFFTHEDFQPEDLYRKYPFLQGSEVLQSQFNTLTVLSEGGAADSVKISFFGGLRFGRLGAPQLPGDGVVEIASLLDSLALKLKVLLQRVEAKDYRDIDALLASGMDLATGLGGARALFPEFAPQECLKALTYFNDSGLKALGPQLERRLVEAVERVHSIPVVAIKDKKLSQSY